MQQQNSESTTCKARLVGLHSKIIDIRNRMEQLPPSDNDFDINERRDKLIHLLIEGQPRVDESEFERGREELFDLLIEGPPRLSVVAILDGIGFDMTAFAADAFNNNHVKFYFDCHAWNLSVSIAYDFGKILDDIIKSVMPPSRVSVIIGEDYQLKKSILRDYLTDKKYFIIWNDLVEFLPDNQNGSRVLITLFWFELQNGEKIQPDSVLVGGPLIRIKYEAWQFFILHYGNTPLENYIGQKAIPTIWSQIHSVWELPFHLKVCCIYLCVFPPTIEISTRQLCQLWIAEGLIPGNYNSEGMVEEYLKELRNSGLIQVDKIRAGGTIKACYVPSYVYAALRWVAEKIGFVKLYSNLEEISLGNAKRSKSQHLALTNWENFWKKFKHLRVLNMGFAVLDQYPSGLENLFHLKYLKLNIPSL
ncbi:Disease resistance protein RPM1 [Citrus sinensis]|uniref:Disease resistance protein RPM1 n=1 Tax=Citrus sinensis TaxID=2711 RepID=A0ACB8KA45_CITSI|nr:Disease resistance protein RPM1 [Citrus sinensis]